MSNMHVLYIYCKVSPYCVAERCAFRLTKDVDLELQWSEAVVFVFLLGSLSCKFVSYFKHPDVLGQEPVEHTIGSFISLMSFSIRLQVFVCIWFLASDIWKADLSGHLSITSWITWYQQKPSWHGEGLHDCWGRTFLRNLAGCWQVALSKLGVHNGF